jgi:hypothetical protein
MTAKLKASESALDNLINSIMENYDISEENYFINDLKRKIYPFLNSEFTTNYMNEKFAVSVAIKVRENELIQFLEYFLLEHARMLYEDKYPSSNELKEKVYSSVLKINRNNREAKFRLAELLERTGFQFLIENDLSQAADSFERIEKIYPSFRSAYEISRMLKNESSINGEILYKIVNEYSWKSPKDLIEILKDNLRKVSMTFEELKIHFDADKGPKPGEIWFAFIVNGKKLRWPSEGIQKLYSNQLYEINETFKVILNKDELLSVHVKGTEVDNKKERIQDLGTVVITLHGEKEWGAKPKTMINKSETGNFTLYTNLVAVSAFEQ